MNPENHTGNTVVKNDKPATEFEDGYTGDIYCKDCGEIIEEGETIPATHEHEYSDEWKSDDENHWHECECGEASGAGSHSFVDGSCSVCGKSAPAEDNSGDNSDSDSDINFDSIEIPDLEIDLGSVDIEGLVSGVISGFGENSGDESSSEDGSSPEFNENDSHAIPDTGSEPIAFAYVLLLSGLASLVIIIFRKKRFVK